MPLLQAILYLGVFTAAGSGALEAGRRRLDPFGVAVVALVTALGGGTLRDLLLGRRPLWIGDPSYLLVALAGAASAYALPRALRALGPAGWRPDGAGRTVLVLDAAMLAVFSLSGTRIAEGAGVPALVAVLMGAITGVAGGLVRDVLCAEVPLVLRREIYATAALAGMGCYVALARAGVPASGAALAGMAVVFGLRVAAIARGFSLPPVMVTGEFEAAD
jgi:uncharacterized membrane protein YeiH